MVLVDTQFRDVQFNGAQVGQSDNGIGENVGFWRETDLQPDFVSWNPFDDDSPIPNALDIRGDVIGDP